MKTYFMNLKKDNFDTQAISDVSGIRDDCFEVSFELEETTTAYVMNGEELSNAQPNFSQEVKDSTEFRVEILRARRDQLLAETMWINERHLSQAEGVKSLSDTAYANWQDYWQSLRDLPGDTATIDAATDLANLATLLPVQPAI